MDQEARETTEQWAQQNDCWEFQIYGISLVIDENNNSADLELVESVEKEIH
jgi:hypothetical protein